ncbi:MAG TPA: hypothetical protein VK464_00410 [Symbiobacteriaceae bacterium]|jgi:hypothetical protein|nr:hypothetical protein [Symbiobacteriaceae bacterium]
MTLPPFAVNAARLIAWAMSQPGERAESLLHFLTFTTRDPNTINHWADALSRIQTFADEQGGPKLALDDYVACVEWVARASQPETEARAEVKRSIFQAAQQYCREGSNHQ